MAFRGAIMLSDKDNVATALEELEARTEVEVRVGGKAITIEAVQKVPFGFKVAVTDIGRHAQVIKYGEPIGIASSDIKKGEMVHVHNLEGGRGRGDMAKGEPE